MKAAATPWYRRIDILTFVTVIVATIPLIWLIWAYSTDNLTVNPIQAATQRTGKFALIFLMLTLAVTPIHTLTGYRNVIKLRRTLGLFTFLYAATHFLLFIGLDYRLDWGLIYQEVLTKRYILVGLGAFLILVPLAITSFRWWMRILGKKWKQLHRLIYLAGILVIFHYGWAKKGDLFRLSGDIWQPLAFGGLLLLLLLLRIPPVRRATSTIKNSFRHKRLKRGTAEKIQQVGP